MDETLIFAGNISNMQHIAKKRNNQNHIQSPLKLIITIKENKHIFYLVRLFMHLFVYLSESFFLYD